MLGMQSYRRGGVMTSVVEKVSTLNTNTYLFSMQLQQYGETRVVPFSKPW